MITSVQNNYNSNILANKKQKNSFGAVDLKNYSPLTLESAFKKDFSKLYPHYADDVVGKFVKEVAARIHDGIQPIIDMFKQNDKHTLTLAVHPLHTGDQYDGLHVIGASVHETGSRIPKGPQVLDYLFVAEKNVLPKMQEFNALKN